MTEVSIEPVAPEVAKPSQFMLVVFALLSESVQGKVKLRQELSGSRAEMKGNRVSPEIWVFRFEPQRVSDAMEKRL